MRNGLLAVALLTLSCSGARKSRYVVPPSPEGAACWQNCEALRIACVRETAPAYRGDCADKQDECLSVCPGATERPQ